MFDDAQWCLMMHNDVWWCTMMFDDAMLNTTQVISSVTGNKKCVSNIADANVLQYLLLVLYMLPSCKLATSSLQPTAFEWMLHQLCLVKNNPFSWVNPPRMLQQLSLILLVKNNLFPGLKVGKLLRIKKMRSCYFCWVMWNVMCLLVAMTFSAQELVLEVLQALTSNTQIVKETMQKGA